MYWIPKKCVHNEQHFFLIKNIFSYKSNFCSYIRLPIKAILMSIRASYGQIFIANLVLGNKATCSYQFVTDKSNDHPVVITQLFILNGLRPYMNFQADIV